MKQTIEVFDFNFKSLRGYWIECHTVIYRNYPNFDIQIYISIFISMIYFFYIDYLPYFDNSMINLKILLDQPIHNYEYFSQMYYFAELHIKLLKYTWYRIVS